MNLRDAIFNWLQIKIVSEARPEDQAAKETLRFFSTILEEDHKLERWEVIDTDDTWICVEYELGQQSKTEKFDRELTEQLLHDINSNPKYN